MLVIECYLYWEVCGLNLAALVTISDFKKDSIYKLCITSSSTVHGIGAWAIFFTKLIWHSFRNPTTGAFLVLMRRNSKSDLDLQSDGLMTWCSKTLTFIFKWPDRCDVDNHAQARLGAREGHQVPQEPGWGRPRRDLRSTVSGQPVQREEAVLGQLLREGEAGLRGPGTLEALIDLFIG